MIDLCLADDDGFSDTEISLQDNLHDLDAAWTPSFELLPPFVPTQIASEIQDPVPELKQLPDFLKYAFLGEGKSFPVVISSKLSPTQEIALLEILKKYKGPLDGQLRTSKVLILTFACTIFIWRKILNRLGKCNVG